MNSSLVTMKTIIISNETIWILNKDLSKQSSLQTRCYRQAWEYDILLYPIPDAWCKADSTTYSVAEAWGWESDERVEICPICPKERGCATDGE